MEFLSLQNLENKLEKLLQRYEQLKKENQKLETNAEKNQTLLLQANEKIAQLQQQNDALKTGVQYLNVEDKKRLQSAIDGYLRDIDKCLSLLDA